MKTSTPSQKDIIRKVRTRIILISLASFLMMVAAKSASAQTFSATAFVEQNITGVQKGAEISTQAFSKIRVAYFFQATEKISFEENANNYPFHGLSVNMPIKNCSGISVWAGVKTGFVNGDFLIVTPQITTEIAIVNHVNLKIMTGYRAGHAAIGSGLSLSF